MANASLPRWSDSRVAQIALIALAYWLAAHAGKLLALPPGYSSPVWPAAGLALAVMLKCGPQCWPGVWLGAFLFNAGLDFSAAGMAASALIAFGSTLQARLGARLTRNLYTGAHIDTRSWHLFLFLLLRGPLICLVASSVGITALVGFGVVARESAGAQWLAWTIGDILGVLLFTPFFMWAWPGRLDSGITRARRMAGPLLATAALLILGHFGVTVLVEQQLRSERAKLSNELYAVVQLMLRDSVDGLYSVERFLAASDDVTQADFATFTRRVAANPAFRAVEWAPLVAHADRTAFERRLRADTPSAERIVHLDAELGMAPAAQAAQYFPVLYSEPLAPNRVAIGLDHSFDAVRVAAMAAARDNASAAATMVERRTRNHGVGNVVFVPVYRRGFDAVPASVPERRNALRGYVVGLYDTERLTAPMASLARDRQLALRITDVTRPATPQWLFGEPPGEAVPSASRVVQFADRAWRIDVESPGSGILRGQSPYAHAYSAASVVFALLACFTFMGVAARAEQLQRDLELVKQLQAAQQASELNLSTTLDSIGDAVIAADVQGRVVRINRAAERLTGHSLASGPVLALAEIFVAIDEATREPIALDLAHAIATGAPVELGRRAMLIPHSGSEVPIVGNLSPILDAAGRARGVVLVFRDVGEQRAMLNDLTESEARFRSLTALSAGWFWEQDAELRFVQITNGQHDSGGVPQERHVGKQRWELPYTEIAGADWDAHRADLEARRPFYNLLLRRNLPEGGRYVLVTGAPRYAADGSFAGYRGVASDVTQAKQAEIDLIMARDAAEAASNAKSAFLANMSHEIRTPMNGVIGMLEVLASSTLSADQEDSVKTIRSSAFILLALIDDILDFSKIEAGHMDLERLPVALAALAEGVCHSLVQVAIGKDVLLSVFIDPRLPATVWSDPTRLRQVLNNLIGNAIKFSAGRPGQPGRVSVRVEPVAQDPLRVAFAIADNGIGMSPQAVAGLFTSFSQAEPSTTRRFGGTGLGLAISRRLVDLMQGTIEVRSTPGSGSVFTVELPLQIAETSTPAVLDDLSGLACIVVDDSPLPLEDLCAYLECGGAQVQRARTCDEAAHHARGLGQMVVVRGCRSDGRSDGQGADAGLASFAGCPDARQVVLKRGRRGRARSEGSDAVAIDIDAMTRAAFLASVATAAGLRSPATARSAPARAIAEPKLEAPTIAAARAAGRLVLVAEDDAVNQTVILRQLALLGYAAEVADDGAEALQLWQGGGHALLLSDLHMPNMDGYTLAQSIRSDEPPGARLPILALTANALKGEAARALACGIDEYLTKPIQLQVLKVALERWMKSISPSAPATLMALPPGADAPSALAIAATADARPASALPSSATLDIAVLVSLVGDDRAAVMEVLADYHAALNRLGPEMRAAQEGGDMAAVAAVAHKLKSSSRSVGALALGELCAELENAGRAALRDSVQRLMQDFEAERERVDACLPAAMAS